MPTSTEIRKQLALDGADPFQIAADALARVAALEAQLAACMLPIAVKPQPRPRS